MTERYIVVQSHGYGKKRSYATFGRMWRSEASAQRFAEGWLKRYSGFGYKKYAIEVVRVEVSK